MMATYRTKRRLVRLRRLRRWWPWVISLGFHFVLLAVLSAVVLVSYRTQAEKPEIIPEARLGKVEQQLPLFQKMKQNIELPRETNLAKNLRDQLMPKEEPRLIQTDLPDSEKFFDPVHKNTPPAPLPGGDLARLQPAAPETRFFSSTGNAYNIVYLVDRSASMIDSIDPLKRELSRSIGLLQPMQKFHIIFFSSGKPDESPAGTLVWATDRNKQQNYAFIDTVTAQGRTDPQWALQRALQLNPDLIYLLTDGVFSPEIADKMIKWAKLHKVKINTIAYVMESGGTLLRRIAEETGGVYRFVSEEQLQ